MTCFKTLREITEHLQGVVRGRSRWLLLTDEPAGFLWLVRLGMIFSLRLIALGVDPSKVLYGGVFGFRSLASGHAADLSFMTIPKAAMTADELTGLLATVGIVAVANKEQDLLVVSNATGRRAEAIQLCLATIEAGKFQSDAADN